MVTLLFKEIRRNPLLWLLVFVPAVFGAEALAAEAHTLHFILSVLAIVPRGKSTVQCSGSKRFTCVLAIGASARVNQ